LIPGTFWESRSSGKFDTPCERMQRAKFSMSRWAWAWFGLVRPAELGELEPHAAITVAAAIAAAVRAVSGHTRRGWRMTRVLLFTCPPQRLGCGCLAARCASGLLISGRLPSCASPLPVRSSA
jgi:hypothetical protein